VTLHKPAPSTWLIAGLVVLIVVAAWYVVMPQLRPVVAVHLGDGVYQARVARTSADRAAGLSNTSSLSDNEAMLFVFDNDNKWSMWMKDMNFPIDIMWLDQSQKITYIVKNASPAGYPQEVFTPKSEARYVVEVKAGTVDSKAIAIGQQVDFDLNQIRGGNR
jgi:uncharacterized membrane protein (UPF0127 family)